MGGRSVAHAVQTDGMDWVPVLLSALSLAVSALSLVVVIIIGRKTIEVGRDSVTVGHDNVKVGQASVLAAQESVEVAKRSQRVTEMARDVAETASKRDVVDARMRRIEVVLDALIDMRQTFNEQHRDHLRESGWSPRYDSAEAHERLDRCLLIASPLSMIQGCRHTVSECGASVTLVPGCACRLPPPCNAPGVNED